jgi:hypothetical protein
MSDIQGIPFSKVHFDKNGRRLEEPMVPAGTTDLIVVSHGWNNNEQEAEALYTKLFGNLATVTRNDAAFGKRKLAIIGVIWPSKRFDQLMTQLGDGGAATGGAKSLGASDRASAELAMRDAIARAAQLFEDPDDADRLAKMRALEALVPRLEKDDAAAQAEFVRTLQDILRRGDETTEQAHGEDGTDILLEGQPAVVFENASQPAPVGGSGEFAATPPNAAAGAPAGGGTGVQEGSAAGLGAFVSKAANAVTNLLNLTTYFEMKQRAGTVGKEGVAPMIDALAARVERIHLVGHSFGGRLVTAAAASSTTNKLHSLSLLQAAFSHNGFSKRGGGSFRSVVTGKRVRGPILVTHSKHDKAVGMAYPAASRIARDTAKSFGGADDKFGGIGSNGAQQMETGEIAATATALLDTNQPYTFEAGRIHNLQSDGFIRDPAGGDAHGFVWVPQVAWAISRAILS